MYDLTLNAYVSRLISKSEVDELNTFTLRRVHLYNSDELAEKYTISTVNGHRVYVCVYSNYRIDYYNELYDDRGIICLINKSKHGLKIYTLKGAAISPIFVKSVEQVRLDEFDYHEGYVNYINIHEEDANDVAARAGDRAHAIVTKAISAINTIDTKLILLDEVTNLLIEGDLDVACILLSDLIHNKLSFEIVYSITVLIGNHYQPVFKQYYRDAYCYLVDQADRSNTKQATTNLEVLRRLLRIDDTMADHLV